MQRWRETSWNHQMKNRHIGYRRTETIIIARCLVKTMQKTTGIFSLFLRKLHICLSHGLGKLGRIVNLWPLSPGVTPPSIIFCDIRDFIYISKLTYQFPLNWGDYFGLSRWANIITSILASGAFSWVRAEEEVGGIHSMRRNHCIFAGLEREGSTWKTWEWTEFSQHPECTWEQILSESRNNDVLHTLISDLCDLKQRNQLRDSVPAILTNQKYEITNMYCLKTQIHRNLLEQQ